MNEDAANGNMPSQRIIELENIDLPLTCPNRHVPVTFLHPRVYLEPAIDGSCICPYCSTRYIIKSLTA